MKRTVNSLELEWSEMHDRLRRMLAKISRRQQREDEREDTQRADGESVVAAVPANGEQPVSSLTPRQLRWQKHLLERRRHAVTKGAE